MPVRQARLRAAIETVLQSNPPRAAAFIVTLYGDVVVPRGGNLWIGNVIDVCARAGINESLVRTSVSRLVANGTLIGERNGRRSFYRLSQAASQEFGYAAQRIYAGDPHKDAGDWTFVQFPRDCLKPSGAERLQKAGFALVCPDLAVAPGAMRGLPQLDCRQDGLLFHARLDTAAGRPALQRFASAHWPLEELDAAYRHFIGAVSPIRQALNDAGGTGDGAENLVARLLLVHEFRRVVLTDPGLPARALPEGWPGVAARRLFAAIYGACSQQADRWIAGNFVDADGPIASAGELLEQRAASLAAMTRPA